MKSGTEYEDERVLMEILQSKDESSKQLINKFSVQQEILNRWLFLKNMGLDLRVYFEEKKYTKIVIYGMADLGCRLLEELEYLGIRVAYGVDKRPMASVVRNRLYIITPDDNWEQDVDVVVVTPVLHYGELKNMIKNKVQCPIVSLKEIIWQI